MNFVWFAIILEERETGFLFLLNESLLISIHSIHNYPPFNDFTGNFISMHFFNRKLSFFFFKKKKNFFNSKFSFFVSDVRILFPNAHWVEWPGVEAERTGSFAPPFAHPLSPLTHSLAPHSSPCSRTPLRSFVWPLAHSLTPDLMGKWFLSTELMRRFHIIETHCAPPHRLMIILVFLRPIPWKMVWRRMKASLSS